MILNSLLFLVFLIYSRYANGATDYSSRYETHVVQSIRPEISSGCASPINYSPWGFTLFGENDYPLGLVYTMRIMTLPKNGTLYWCGEINNCTTMGQKVEIGDFRTESDLGNIEYANLIYLPNEDYHNRHRIRVRSETGEQIIETLLDDGGFRPAACEGERDNICTDSFSFLFSTLLKTYYYVHRLKVYNRVSPLKYRIRPGYHPTIAQAVEIYDPDGHSFYSTIGITFDKQLPWYAMALDCDNNPPYCSYSGLSSTDMYVKLDNFPLPEYPFMRVQLKLKEKRRINPLSADELCAELESVSRTVYVTVRRPEFIPQFFPPGVQTRDEPYSPRIRQTVFAGRGRVAFPTPYAIEYTPYDPYNFSVTTPEACRVRPYDEFTIQADFKVDNQYCLTPQEEKVYVCKIDDPRDPSALDFTVDSTLPGVYRKFSVHVFDTNDDLIGEDDEALSWYAFRNLDGNLMPNSGIIFGETNFSENVYIARRDCQGGALDPDLIHNDTVFCFVTHGFHDYIQVGYYPVDNYENLGNSLYEMGTITFNPPIGVAVCMADETTGILAQECTTITKETNNIVNTPPVKITIQYLIVGTFTDTFWIEILTLPQHGTLYTCADAACNIAGAPVYIGQKFTIMGNPTVMMYQGNPNYFNYHAYDYSYMYHLSLLARYGPFRNDEYYSTYTRIMESNKEADYLINEYGSLRVPGFEDRLGQPFHNCGYLDSGCPDFFTFTVHPEEYSAFPPGTIHRHNIYVENVPSEVYIRSMIPPYGEILDRYGRVLRQGEKNRFGYIPGEKTKIEFYVEDPWDKNTYDSHVQLGTSHESVLGPRFRAGFGDSLVEVWGTAQCYEDGSCDGGIIYSGLAVELNKMFKDFTFEFLRNQRQTHNGTLFAKVFKARSNIVLHQYSDLSQTFERSIIYLNDFTNAPRNKEKMVAGQMEYEATNLAYYWNRYVYPHEYNQVIAYEHRSPDIKYRAESSVGYNWVGMYVYVPDGWDKAFKIMLEIFIAGTSFVPTPMNAAIIASIVVGAKVVTVAAKLAGRLRVIRAVASGMRRIEDALDIARIFKNFRLNFPKLKGKPRKGGANSGGVNGVNTMSRYQRIVNSIKSIGSKPSKSLSNENSKLVLGRVQSAQRSVSKTPPQPARGAKQKNAGKNKRKKPTKAPTPKPTIRPTSYPTKKKTPSPTRPTMKPTQNNRPTKRPNKKDDDDDNPYKKKKDAKNKLKKQAKKKYRREVDKDRAKKKSKGGIRKRTSKSFGSMRSRLLRDGVWNFIVSLLKNIISFVVGLGLGFANMFLQTGIFCSKARPKEEEEEEEKQNNEEGNEKEEMNDDNNENVDEKYASITENENENNENDENEGEEEEEEEEDDEEEEEEEKLISKNNNIPSASSLLKRGSNRLFKYRPLSTLPNSDHIDV